MKPEKAAWYCGLLCELKGRPEDAFSYYSKSAELGYIPAFRRLGEFYYDGICVEKNYGRAFHCFLHAARAGDAYAQYSLGILYALGLGAAQNLDESTLWLEKAASQDNGRALFELGRRYFCGEFVLKDQEKALMLIQKSAALGEPEAQYFLYMQDRSRLDLLKRAANSGYPLAQMELAAHYELAGDSSSAFPWYERAARTIVEARMALASYYMDGTLPKDFNKAAEYLERSVDPAPGDTVTREGSREFAMELLYYVYRTLKKPDAALEIAKRYAQEFQTPLNDLLNQWQENSFD